MTVAKINYDRSPRDYPDSDLGNLKMYYELELLRSNYESNRLMKQLTRYAVILDTLGNRGLYVDFDTDLAIDKALHKADWDELLGG